MDTKNYKKMNIKHLTIIILLLFVTGLIIYYLFMKPEPFYDSLCSDLISSTPLPKSIFSRYFGVGFNILPISDTTPTIFNTTNTGLFIIEHIPVVYNGTMGSVYSLSTDGQLTIKVKNSEDTSQWWKITKKKDSTPSTTNPTTTNPTTTSSTITSNNKDYYIVQPNMLVNTNPPFALQYENGNLALRPYDENNIFESQKWIISNTLVKRGIPVLNYSPASLFTPEFDPYSTSTSINTSSLSPENNQQVNEVINAIKTNLQQYLQTINANSTVPQVTSSSLGTSSMPLNINLNLGSSSGSGSSVSRFDNITGTSTANDVLSLLNRYESITNKNNNTELLTQSNLQEELAKSNGCQNINLSDFTSNRVSSCNCKL